MRVKVPGAKLCEYVEALILSGDPISIPVSIAGHSPKLRVCVYVYVLYGYTLQCVCVCVMSTHCALSAV